MSYLRRLTSCTPNINSEAFVSLIKQDFRCDVGWSPALVFDFLSSFHDLTDSKVTNLNMSECIKQNVVELDISMKNAIEMAVVKPTCNLQKHELSQWFFKSASLSHVIEKITSSTQLHHKENVLLSFKGLEQVDNVRVSDSFENRDFLHHFSLAALVLEHCLVHALDCDQLVSQLVKR